MTAPSRLLRFVPNRGRDRIWLFLLLYPFAFKAAHMMASPWGGAHFFSLWFPAAGVRLALLWHAGARYAPILAIEECLIQIATGTISLSPDLVLPHLSGVARAPLAYGAMVALVRVLEKRSRSELAIAPMPFGLAAVLAPTLAAFVAGLWEWAWPNPTSGLADQPFAITIAAFLVGDLLGVLLLAPALLWLVAPSSRTHMRMLSGPRAAEAVLIFCLGWLLALGLAGYQPQIAVLPVLIAATWVGLRCGRQGAWAAIILSAAIILPWSAGMQDVPTRFALHMSLAATAIAAYLAGSFAETQLIARQELARRDRILFQAERLKTLRAMSVAIIHEISQPLSTLAIETRHLLAQAGREDWDRRDMAQSIALVERKAALLADMVRRLRGFGGRAVDEPSVIPVARLLRDATAIVGSEAREQGCAILLPDADPELGVMGHEIELAQILTNLLRNAIQAAPRQHIAVRVEELGDRMAIHIENPHAGPVADRGGMGIGLLVARAITDAHGGTLTSTQKDGMTCYSVSLPMTRATDG